jgi:uncharacterized protein
MHSALYRGWLDHRRVAPRPHAFRYPLFMVYLDLGELDRVFRGRWLWSTRRTALARFARDDHLGDPRRPLDECVRDLVEARLGPGLRPTGPIRLLTHLRYFGYVFNPVSFYYCFDAADRRVEAVVAEVANTPWGERHCYVLRQESPDAHWLRAQCAKAMHVSPFNPMDLRYDWQLTMPGEALGVHMTLTPPGATAAAPIFGATLALRRVAITGPSLAFTLARFPLMTAQVMVGIHWQALRLWLKGVPVHDHPAQLPTLESPEVPS